LILIALFQAKIRVLFTFTSFHFSILSSLFIFLLSKEKEIFLYFTTRNVISSFIIILSLIVNVAWKIKWTLFFTVITERDMMRNWKNSRYKISSFQLSKTMRNNKKCWFKAYHKLFVISMKNCFANSCSPTFIGRGIWFVDR
jgi:hypothetical protein